MTDHERKLLKKIKKGNQQAFRTLYDRYANDAIRTVYAITRSHHDTLDIVQEAFIKVYRHIDRYDLNKPFKPWLYRILINESMRYMKNKTKTAVPLGEDMITYLDKNKITHENEDLEMAMEQLHPEIRTLLVLKYLHAYTEKEIAELLNIPDTTVKSRLYKARNELRAHLGGIAHEEQ